MAEVVSGSVCSDLVLDNDSFMAPVPRKRGGLLRERGNSECFPELAGRLLRTFPMGVSGSRTGVNPNDSIAKFASDVESYRNHRYQAEELRKRMQTVQQQFQQNPVGEAPEVKDWYDTKQNANERAWYNLVGDVRLCSCMQKDGYPCTVKEMVDGMRLDGHLWKPVFELILCGAVPQLHLVRTSDDEGRKTPVLRAGSNQFNLCTEGSYAIKEDDAIFSYYP